MTDDQELRTLVRSAIARHAMGGSVEKVGHGMRSMTPPGASTHASHARLPVLRGGDGDGACLIEPAVRCNHCGYCQSYGH